MVFEEFKDILKLESKKMNINFNEEQIENFYKYMNLLLEWNQKINLTAITDEREIIIKHFLDSLTIAKYIDSENSLADIGTGAGFPGIPIKIYKPDIKITLVDSLNKRINFLDEVIKDLKLNDIETVHSRAEDLGRNKNYREMFDVVTSRAVANMSVLSEYLLPLVKVGGKCICMKGSEIEEELQNSKYAIKLLGGEIEKVDTFELSDEHLKRNIILIKKIKNTANVYPRKAGIPVKKPLSRD